MASIIAFSRCLSGGTCHITTSTSFDNPAIDPRCLTHLANVEVLSNGVTLSKKYSQRRLYKRGSRGDTSSLLAKPIQLNSVAEVCNKVLWHRILSYRRSCLGQATEEKLHIRGAKELRLVDASVFLVHISMSLVATAYAVRLSRRVGQSELRTYRVLNISAWQRLLSTAELRSIRNCKGEFEVRPLRTKDIFSRCNFEPYRTIASAPPMKAT
jgi:hypothetical protein